MVYRAGPDCAAAVAQRCLRLARRPLGTKARNCLFVTLGRLLSKPNSLTLTYYGALIYGVTVECTYGDCSNCRIKVVAAKEKVIADARKPLQTTGLSQVVDTCTAVPFLSQPKQ